MSTAKDLLVIDASEHTYCPDPNDPHNPPRDVRDIREAMHPAESAGAVLDAFAHKPIDIGESGRAAVQGVVNEIAAKVMPGHEPPSPTWTLLQPGPSTAHVNRPYVATLPDGTRVNLPAGTVLREGEDANPTEHPLLALVRSFIGKPGKPGPVWSAFDRLREQIGAGDLAAAESAASDLEEALNERLGQMHDALGRDADERTL